MAEWFETKVSYLRQMDNGLIKKITEQYLVDSMSFTEAEGRVMTEVGEGMREVTVVSIKRSNIKETVMYGDTDLFFKVKVSYELTDEETEKSKKVSTYLLVNAHDAKEAYDRTCEHLKEMLVPFSIVSIAESHIIEVYQYQNGLRPGLRRVTKEEPAESRVVNHRNLEGGDLYDEMTKAYEHGRGVTTALDASARGEGIVDMGCAYSKSDQVGKRKRQRSHDDGYGHPIIELPLVKPIDPTHGQAVTFEIFDAAYWVGGLSNAQHGLLIHNFSTIFLGGDRDEFVAYLQKNFDLSEPQCSAVISHLIGDDEDGPQDGFDPHGKTMFQHRPPLDD